jgi:hypothetical protein
VVFSWSLLVTDRRKLPGKRVAGRLQSQNQNSLLMAVFANLGQTKGDFPAVQKGEKQQNRTSFRALLFAFGRFRWENESNRATFR